MTPRTLAQGWGVQECSALAVRACSTPGKSGLCSRLSALLGTRRPTLSGRASTCSLTSDSLLALARTQSPQFDTSLRNDGNHCRQSSAPASLHRPPPGRRTPSAFFPSHSTPAAQGLSQVEEASSQEAEVGLAIAIECELFFWQCRQVAVVRESGGKGELTGERSAEPVTLPSHINDLPIVTPASGRRVRVRALVSQPDHAQLAMEVRRCPAGSVAGGAHGFSPGTRTRGREARPNRTTVRHRAAFRRHAGQGYPLQPSPLDCLLLSRFASQSADRTQCFA